MCGLSLRPFRVANIRAMVLAMTRADPLFKLRLPHSLRAQLQRSAMENGRSLTAEILDRLDSTFPSVPERLAALEARVLDPNRGLDRLLERLQELERQVAELSRRG